MNYLPYVPRIEYYLNTFRDIVMYKMSRSLKTFPVNIELAAFCFTINEHILPKRPEYFIIIFVCTFS